MGRFLIAVWPFRGHVVPLVALGVALRERGHEVAIYTGTDARTIVEGEGFPFFPFRSVDEKRIDSLMFSRATYASWTLPRDLKALLKEWLLGTVPDQVSDLAPLVAEWRPDVIVSETSMWAPMLVLRETHDIPVGVFSTVAACLLPGREAPVVGLGLPRPTAWHTRLLARAARRTVDLLSWDFRRAVNDMRRRYGLAPLDVSFTEFTGRMPLYLVPSTPEFDYHRGDLPPSVHYIGPCLFSKPAQESAPAWLRDLPRDRPCVHVTEGTMHTQKPVLLTAAARGLAGMPAEVILTTGGRREPAELGLGDIGGNVRVERWISHEILLPRLDLLVTTGGAGTVMAALRAGVPLIVVPTEWDKPENAQRVVEAGAGLRLSPRRCTPGRLRSAVERVLGDPSFRDNARRLAASFARYEGPAAGARLLEELSSRKPPGGEVDRSRIATLPV